MKGLLLLSFEFTQFCILILRFSTVECSKNVDVHPDLLKADSSTSDIIITLKGFDEIVNSVTRQGFDRRESRLDTLVSSLESHASVSQAPILTYLLTQQLLFPTLRFKGYWISNQILVFRVHKSLISTLSLFDLIASITPQRSYKIPPLSYESLAPQKNNWGVGRIRAPEAWKNGIDGKGVVVGSIDTGVRYTHEVLKDNFLGDEFSWYDPSGVSPKIPTDPAGHGSHTTGIMVGKNNIGVAPSAKWIACRGCSAEKCSTKDLLECSQFMLCPTTFDGKVKNCSKAPLIINNSWGGADPGDTTFLNVIKSWVAGDIFPVFSVGNSGPNCSSVGSPADTDVSLITSVGATGLQNELAEFSSKGPDHYKKIKPEVVAPGANIYSSIHTGDNDYAEISGTSMAAPHVSGLFALLRQKYPSMKYSKAQEILFKGCRRVLQNFTGSGAAKCGGVSNIKFPNNNFGYGIIDAVNSVVS